MYTVAFEAIYAVLIAAYSKTKKRVYMREERVIGFIDDSRLSEIITLSLNNNSIIAL